MKSETRTFQGRVVAHGTCKEVLKLLVWAQRRFVRKGHPNRGRCTSSHIWMCCELDGICWLNGLSTAVFAPYVDSTKDHFRTKSYFHFYRLLEDDTSFQDLPDTIFFLWRISLSPEMDINEDYCLLCQVLATDAYDLFFCDFSFFKGVAQNDSRLLHMQTL